MAIKKEILQSLLLLTLFCCVVTGCQLAPDRDFTEDELLIGLDVMPDRWEVMETVGDGVLPYEGAQANAAIFFRALGTDLYAISSEIVYRYWNENQAAQNYRRLSEDRCGNNRDLTHVSPFPMPDNIETPPLSADQWCLGCLEAATGIYNGRYCKFQAQYEEFVIDYTVAFELEGEQIISIAEIEEVVRAIDERMAERLR